MYYSSSTDMNKLDQFEVVSKFEPHIAALHVPVILTEHNYSLWKPFVVTTLKSHGMFDMVTKTECACTPSIVDDVNDKLCMHFINLTLSEAMLAYVASDPACMTARGLWSMLEKQGEIAQRLVTELRDELEYLEKEDDEPMSDYYDRAKELVDELKACGTWISDDVFVEHLLKGLPSCYVDVVNSIRVESIGRGNDLYNLLVDEETELPNKKREEATKLLQVAEENKRREKWAHKDARNVLEIKVRLLMLILMAFFYYLIQAYGW